MPNTRSKGAPLVPYNKELHKTFRKIVIEEAVNNPPRVVDENIVRDGIIPPHRQLMSPRGSTPSTSHDV